MRKHFYYPAMESDIRMRTNLCLFCLAKKKVSLKDGIHHGYEASFPMQRIYVDLYGPLPVVDEAYIKDKKAGGKRRDKDEPVKLPPSYLKRYVLTIQDAWSCFILLVPMTD